MLYVVHTIPDMKSRNFRMHKAAYQAFKIAARRNMTVALWHCNAKGQWTMVHSSGLYPSTLTQPYVNLYDSNKSGAA